MPGRKSIPRMADRFAGSSQQALQQFVNQSPWSSRPIRAELARAAFESIEPRVWVIDELVFPKQGMNSAGVAVQFVPSPSRTIRCQLGLGLFLVGEAGAVPVSERLMELGDPADESDDSVDPARRWHYVMDLLDEMRGEWALPPLPVIIDARRLPVVHDLVDRLERSGHSYAIQVSREGPLPVLTGPRRLVTDATSSSAAWTFSWLTNLPAAQTNMTRMACHRWRVREVLRELRDQHGLAHFQGRSGRGWHHHVTLVSLAYAFRMLTEVVDWLPSLPVA